MHYSPSMAFCSCLHSLRRSLDSSSFSTTPLNATLFMARMSFICLADSSLISSSVAISDRYTTPWLANLRGLAPGVAAEEDADDAPAAGPGAGLPPADRREESPDRNLEELLSDLVGDDDRAAPRLDSLSSLARSVDPPPPPPPPGSPSPSSSSSSGAVNGVTGVSATSSDAEEAERGGSAEEVEEETVGAAASPPGVVAGVLLVDEDAAAAAAAASAASRSRLDRGSGTVVPPLAAVVAEGETTTKSLTRSEADPLLSSASACEIAKSP